MSLARVLEPETLDHLAENDPRAIHSRRDLQRINRLMGSAGIIGRTLKQSCRAHDRIAPEATPDKLDQRRPKRILELGAGDGTLMLRLAARFAREWPGVHVTLLDRQDLVSEETRAAFGRLGWQVDTLCADVNEWAMQPNVDHWDACIANLFIHHFDERQIVSLFAALAARTGSFIACEPRRTRMPLYMSHLVGLLGANKVTREDAVLSVRAGFCGGELSALWPRKQEWRLEERATGLFSHLFTAVRERDG